MFNDTIKPKKKLLNSERIGSFVEIAESQQVHYYEAGIGPPLLLIHGIGQSLYAWHSCIDELSREHHVFALDLPGFGYSDKGPEIPMDVDGFVEQIVAFMDAIDLQKAHVLGNGSGAIIALRLLEMHPYRVGRLSAISPGGFSPDMPFAIRALRIPAISWLFKMLFNRGTMQKALDDCFFDQTLINDEMVEQYYIPFETPEGKNALVRAICEFDEEETMNELRTIEKDVQLIWGIDDKWRPYEIAEDFHIALNNSEVHYIRNCGHLVAEEKLDRLIELVVPFLKDGINPASVSR